MSEQPEAQSNLIGAALLGFVVVMTIGGGALMLHTSRRAKGAEKPAPAAAPIDIGASAPRMIAPADEPAPQKAPASAAPAVDADAVVRADAAARSSPTPAAPVAAAGAKTKAPALAPSEHLEASGGSSAVAVVKNDPVPEASGKAEKAEKPDGKKAVKSDAAGVASSVHYGAASRSELMGRAAGPVLNFKGGAAKGGSGATGKMADGADATILSIQRQLEASGLPPEQRAKLQKDLEAALKGPESPPTAAAQ